MQDEKQQNQVEVSVPATQTVTFEHSQGIGKLVDALSKAGAEFKPAFKDAINPTYRDGSKYVPLENLIDATREALSKHGLAVMQLPSVDETNVLVTTLLAHSSGEWISSTLSLPGDQRGRFDAQSVGSGITYARRYAYQSILNIAGEVDDDGNAAAGVGSKEAAQAVAKQKIEQSIGEKKLVLGTLNETHYGLVGEAWKLIGQELKAAGGVCAKDGTGWSIPKTSLNDVQASCKAAGIELVLGIDGPMAAPKAIIPAMPHAPDVPESPKSGLPLLTKAEKVKGKKGEFLSVEWGGQKASCFKKHLWEALQAGALANQPADLVTSRNGDWTNVDDIVQIGNRAYEVGAPMRNINDFGEVPFY